jgi:DNA-binding CsgD family transcriptional regulator
VFAAGCSLDAAEAVCAAGDVARNDVLDLLHQLIDKSLVLADEQAGRTRYRLLEPVRQYAHERLVTGGELSEARGRHLLYFLAFAERFERAANVGGPDRPAATAALGQEYPNILLALGWSLESGEAQIGLRLARTVQFWWQVRGYPSDGLAWLERLLVLPGGEEPTPARAVCLLAAGRLAIMLGKLETARAYCEAGLSLASTMADPWVQWLGKQNSGSYALLRGDHDTASRYQQEALAIARAVDDHIDEAITLASLTRTALVRGDYARAQALGEEARRVARVAGEAWAESLATVFLGLLALVRGEHATAKVDLTRGLEMCRQNRDPTVMAQALEGLGRVAMAEGQHEEADLRLAESLTLRHEIGDRPGVADTLESLAAVAATLSRPQTALQLAGAAAALRQAIGAAQSPMRHDLLERWLPALQLDVGEEVSARSWATGQAMTIQETIALALTMHESAALLSQPQKEVSALVAGLTSREAEVLRLLAQGQSNKEIAAELVLSVRTVERHITNLYGKIDARGKADATAYAIRHGLA